MNQLACKDVMDGLRDLPDRCVQTCVTSPPYWGLRDYGIAGQIGLEPTVEEWVARLVEVFREVRRVLRDDGTLWLNLGDSYAQAGGPGWQGKNGQRADRRFTLVRDTVAMRETTRRPPTGLKSKDLIGQPWRVAFALQADGWYLRSEIIWHKPNPMPESVTDRPTKAHEQIFLLSKSANYFYDADAVREPATHAGKIVTLGPKSLSKGQAAGAGVAASGNGRADSVVVADGRNLRSVWTIATTPYPEAHFATFPEAIPKRCIMAGTSERGACGECGAPWERVVVEERDESSREARGKALTSPRHDGHSWNENKGRGFLPTTRTATDWQPTCECWPVEVLGDGRPHTPVWPRPCLVLDPFAGSGTTLAVAQELGRDYVGIELSPEYVELARRRLSITPVALPMGER